MSILFKYPAVTVHGLLNFAITCAWTHHFLNIVFEYSFLLFDVTSIISVFYFELNLLNKIIELIWSFSTDKLQKNRKINKILFGRPTSSNFLLIKRV